MLPKSLALFLLLFLGCVSAKAGQALTDSAGHHNPRSHSPKFAGTLSAVFPGTGQIYNRKFWKLPIVYGACGGMGYLIFSNHRTYSRYRDVIKFRTGSNPSGIDLFPEYSTEQLLTLQDQARRNRDLFIIAGTLIYALQIVDAVVDAHLKTFDVSDDLSLVPVLLPVQQGSAAGLSLVWRW